MKRYITAGLLLCATMTVGAQNDATGKVGEPVKKDFVVISGDPRTDLKGGVALKLYKEGTTLQDVEQVYGAPDALKCPDAFTQNAYNAESKLITGFIYTRAAAAKEIGGIGENKSGLRICRVVDGDFAPVGAPVYLENFGNVGTFGAYTYAAQVSAPVVKVIDGEGNAHDVQLNAPSLQLDGATPSIANIVDLGDNRVAIVLTYKDNDNVHVALANYELKVSKILTSDKIGASVGAHRSVRYAQSGVTDAGDLYLFSGAATDDHKVGALRIKKGADDFDPDYAFDILTAADGYRFRKVFHITGDKFLVEFFNDKSDYANMSAGGKIAIVDVVAKSVTWVSGLPEADRVSIGWGDASEGFYYLPVSAKSDFGAHKDHGAEVETTKHNTVAPTIYMIDAERATATPFITFGERDLLKAIFFLK